MAGGCAYLATGISTFLIAVYCTLGLGGRSSGAAGGTPCDRFDGCCRADADKIIPEGTFGQEMKSPFTNRHPFSTVIFMAVIIPDV